MYSSEEPHQQHNHQHRLQHGQRVDDHDECLIELTVGARYGVKPANGSDEETMWKDQRVRPVALVATRWCVWRSVNASYTSLWNVSSSH